MPELPEAETLVRGLRPSVVGRTIDTAEVIHADVLRRPTEEFRAAVGGRAFRDVGRRGKNVILELDADGVIAVNLGMTGTLLPFSAPPTGGAAPTHPAVVFHLVSGGVLIFQDTRRFGTVEYLSSDAWAARSAGMGPEPLDPAFTPEDLVSGMRRSRAPARSWLLDQRRIAGIGNIYANEALYLAGIHPQRPARTVTGPEGHRLHGALRDVLTRAIEAGGTTIRDYRNAEGEPGRFARRLRVYGRDGEPCDTCGRQIRRIVFANRSAFACPGCQPRSRGRR
ncbi:MAG: bifunctional DNA-formamidopyrimidine glycosylase/DNA-(apurinic or apyrimidinic site) lyase [Longimicrobiales bacterium]